MPGAYAHITLVNEFRNMDRLFSIPNFPPEASKAYLKWFKFVELGAVGPDYPYLALGDGDAAEWADLMHYVHTGRMVQEGAKLLRAAAGETKQKCLAWLLGYASHITADVTIHPVVELKVGPYAQNQNDHRTCEMHQDAFIFQRLQLGEVGVSDHLKSGIGACSSTDDEDLLDQDILEFWRALLKAVYPAEFAANPPDIHKWHEKFNEIVDAVSSIGDHLFPFARHVAANSGLLYPSTSEIDQQYIDALTVPGGVMAYQDVFEMAAQNVAAVWSEIAVATFTTNDAVLARFGDWNLDTGKDQTDRLVFWG
ncbi:zinc dependent phospholipase C family protein [Citrifermentans bremense]|uniref:zinc dependent phospholipase C family protein n=1 Tax=Citrifermentans bremense TaxID=60035 RepID=UPI0004789E8C|nr:zinc dependent phospholipase C family protein [Citrifermentans bremense]